MKKQAKDSRLVGQTAENIFLSLLNEKGVFAAALDTVGFDGIVFDLNREYFRIGTPPFYVQIKTRGSQSEKFNPQGHSKKIFEKIKLNAARLEIPHTSLYLVAGFFKNSDLRTICFFGIPFESLEFFSSSDLQYRFSVTKCETATTEVEGVFMI